MSIFRLSVVTSFFFAVNIVATNAHADTKVIHAGELLAIPGEKPQQKQIKRERLINQLSKILKNI